MVICMLGLIFIMSGCSKKAENDVIKNQENITIYYQADSGNFLKNTYPSESKEDEEQAKDKGKTIIYFQNGHTTDTGLMSYLVAAFNRENELYHVEMTRPQSDGDFESVKERLRVEVSTGKGPDIMTTDIFPVSMEIIQKGYLVDLAPLMVKSNITDEKYFPAYKCLTDGDKVYGLCPSMYVLGMSIDEKVLGNNEVPNLETLLDALLAYPEPAAFLNAYQDGIHIMDYFLCGSEDLWGMIDWENRKCDFSNELFSKILDVSKRYADDGKSGYDPIMRNTLYYIGLYPGREALEKEGRVIIEYYFDDGNYPKYFQSVETLVISSNTKNLEGAWAFISYAMSKTGQSYCALPTHKELFTEKNHAALEDLEAGTAYMAVDLTEEILQDVTNVFETGKYCPKCTEEILNIIYEEAGAYYAGDKKKEEVIKIIQQRVQLLLDE
ncbi:MAG: ABC transporter substrate-binding protein [Acetatifactor sp.]